VPAAIAFQFTRRQGALAAISWLAGALASAAGLWVSFHYDLPTGPVVVCMFGLVLLGAYCLRRLLGVRTAAVGEAAVGEAAVVIARERSDRSNPVGCRGIASGSPNPRNDYHPPAALSTAASPTAALSTADLGREVVKLALDRIISL
jgi:hypothetical protein